MFLIDKQWRSTGRLDILTSLLRFGEFELHEVVELFSDIELYHVNLLLAGEDQDIGIWTRFICSSRKVVVDLIDQNEFAGAEIWLQTRRGSTAEYSIVSVNYVIETMQTENDPSYLFITGTENLAPEHNSQVELHSKGLARVVYKKVS